MPKEFGRNRRVADLIQRDLAGLIQREMDSKRFGLITVSMVDVGPDLLNARVFVTNLGDNVDREALIIALNKRAGHFRHVLAQHSQRRTTPRLDFVFDTSIEQGSRLSALIDSVQIKRDNESE